MIEHCAFKTTTLAEKKQTEKEFSKLIYLPTMKKFLLVILIIFYSFQQFKANYYPYKHYSRHPTGEITYDNETISGNDDDSNMCHLSVRCPTIPMLGK